MSILGRVLNRLTGSEEGAYLAPRERTYEHTRDAHTLEPAGAAIVHLAPTFKLEREATQWPDGFWNHFNSANSHYKRGRYRKAKEAYSSARSLLAGYGALNTALLRTYRKLYRGAIDKKRWDEAYQELCELFETLPSGVSDTDRRQFKKVVEVLKKSGPGFLGQPMPLQEQRQTRGEKPSAEVESASDKDIAVQRDEMWERPKGEKPLRWQENQLTSGGFLAVHRRYDEQAGGYRSCNIRTYSSHGDIESEKDWPRSFYRLKTSNTGEHLIGYSDDLQMSLSTLSGDILAERSVARAADGNKYHIRCVDLSEGGMHCLFTSATRAYLLDQRLRTLCVWIMPPPPGYQVERGGHDAGHQRIEMALATLELTGQPTQEVIRAQFRRLVLRYHPDRNPGDTAAQERTKEIIAAYKMVSEEDVAAALEGLGDREHYRQILHETELDIGDTGYSVKLTMSMSGPGDWIYATHMTARAERIYLGCYSGLIYCVDLDGNVLKVYQTDAPIDGIVERGRHLYIWTHTSLYVLDRDKVVSHIDLRGGSLKCFTEWGLIVKKGSSLVLCSADGTWLANVRFQREAHEVIPTSSGLVAYTTKERFRVSLSDAPAASCARS
jgi:hypothetical protein